MEGESIEGFLKWAAGLGISDSPTNTTISSSCLGHSLTVSHFPDAGGRGLAAVRDLKKGEMILGVPKSALFSTALLLQDDSFLSSSLNPPSTTILSSSQVLTVCLLYEMNKAKLSRWYPYLVLLPRTYDLLSTFSEFEKNALQVEDAIWTTEKAVSRAQFEWKHAFSLMKLLRLKPQFLTFKAWLWATSTISSRTLHVPWDKAGCLCPVGDLFNYAAPGDDSSDDVDISLSTGSTANDMSLEHSGVQILTDGGFNEDIKAYCFYARKNYKTGKQVLLSYGTYTNLELLEHYGFLLNKNPNDKIFIPLESDMFLTTSWPKESMYIHQDGKPSFALLCALRLWATPKSQQKPIRHLAYSGCQLSTDNEISVMTWISKTCEVLLNNMPTSTEEDVSLMSVIDKIQNARNSAELREVLLIFGDKFAGFLEGNGQQKTKNYVEFPLSGKMRRAMDRWGLAIEWRVRYKTTLNDSICYCKKIIDMLGMRTK